MDLLIPKQPANKGARLMTNFTSIHHLSSSPCLFFSSSQYMSPAIMIAAPAIMIAAIMIAHDSWQLSWRLMSMRLMLMIVSCSWEKPFLTLGRSSAAFSGIIRIFMLFMPKIQGTFINCIIMSLTQSLVPTARDTLAIRSKAADKLARRVATWSLSCSTAVKQGVPCKNLLRWCWSYANLE